MNSIRNSNNNKVSNFSDLIQRVTSSCLLNPIGSNRHYSVNIHSEDSDSDSDYEQHKSNKNVVQEATLAAPTEQQKQQQGDISKSETATFMNEVFETVSCLKKAYVSLQEAHSPYDADKMRLSDMAVVAELKKLGVLRERWRRSVAGGGGGGGVRTVGGVAVREVVAPYEAAMEKMKMEVKSKEVEIQNLKDKLNSTTVSGGGGSGRISRSHSSHQSKKKVNYGNQLLGKVQLFRHYALVVVRYIYLLAHFALVMNKLPF
ncbi:putative protein gravitropic in the light 1 [Helianthus annuus]|nr:putative protein gravitropic in the light 1 [Helianthus annuus]